MHESDEEAPSWGTESGAIDELYSPQSLEINLDTEASGSGKFKEETPPTKKKPTSFHSSEKDQKMEKTSLYWGKETTVAFKISFEALLSYQQQMTVFPTLSNRDSL